MGENKELKNLRSLDFFMGLFFTMVGGYMILASLAMFRDPILAGTPIVSNPGITSLVIGLFLVVLGVTMAVIGLRGSGHPLKVGRQALGELIRRRSFWRAGLVLGLIAFYFFVLWNHSPFWFSTMVFLVLTMRIFGAGAWWKILLIAGVTTALIIYFFGHLAKVLLPSDPGILSPLYELIKAII
ncbi:MAG: tripartite tricarboxylate transporter TctB family protein [Bacillota bacterium]